jgi:hypothetical protein
MVQPWWNAMDQQMVHQIKCHQNDPNQQQAFSLLDYLFTWYRSTWVITLTASVATTSTAQWPYIKPNKQETTNANSDPASLPTWIQ